jgi:hypothetical protein
LNQLEATTTLYRPVGQAEWDLICSTGRFPPRLVFQPIFYPVVTFEYAEKIARGWNTKDPASGYVGFVTRFEVETAWLNRYPVQEAGGRDCQEYWIPAEELDEFNRHIVGKIQLVATYTSDSPTT